MRAKIIKYDGRYLTIEPSKDLTKALNKQACNAIDFDVIDGRILSKKQKKKIFAIIGDIANYTGELPEYLRVILTWQFCELYGYDLFSLSAVKKTAATVTIAREFINYLINFCFEYDVPTRDTMLNRTDDIRFYLYSCLYYRKCAICNNHADIHHIDAVGMGRDRTSITHKGLRAIALCRKHHQICHTDEKGFLKNYKVFGIPLDDTLCEKLNLRNK